ncbi:unnamed protein product [Durusdinium trenchii]|uniref:Haloacid dehalogenase-like hydrolase domain-containing protein 3 n=1 Tax=Durusdinium trenchii TaxID=1381693 RepID=A0ABP0RVF8_9DINO
MARVLWPAVKALSLDVTGTLLVHRHPIHETYAACALWAKLENPPSAEELKPAFKEAFRETSKSGCATGFLATGRGEGHGCSGPGYPCFGHEDNLSSRSWWALVVKAALRHCGRNYADQDFDRFFRRVYQHYGTLDAYEELSDAKPFLDWARQQGLAIGVTTNSDTRTLDDVLPMLGFHDHLRWFVCGREVGSEKPEPWIFVETYRQANFWVDGIKREEILHIGDSLAADFCGARAAGLQVLLDSLLVVVEEVVVVAAAGRSCSSKCLSLLWQTSSSTSSS